MTTTVIFIFFILVGANNTNDTPSKSSLLCIGIIFKARYHLGWFDGTHAVGAYEQSNLDIFSIGHELICNT